MISIIIPIFNTKKYLSQCIDSILNQSYKNIEIILVDDGSTDGSECVCEKYADKYHNIIFLKQKHSGPFKARKRGLDIARGDYITFVDSDDFISENAYELAEDEMQKNTDLIIFGIYRYFNDDCVRHEKCFYPDGEYDEKKIKCDIYPTMLWDDNTKRYGLDPSLCTKLFKKELIQSLVSKMDHFEFHYGEDMAVLYPCIRKAKSLRIFDDSFYFHRQTHYQQGISRYYMEDSFLHNIFRLYDHLLGYLQDDDQLVRQLEIWYADQVQKNNLKYNSMPPKEGSVFPFDKVDKGDNIVIYGAGNLGKLYMKQLERLDYCKVVLWVDKNKYNSEKNISKPEDILTVPFDHVVISVVDRRLRDEIIEFLLKIGIDKSKIV